MSSYGQRSILRSNMAKPENEKLSPDANRDRHYVSVLKVLLGSLLLLSAISYIKFGPYLSPDTLSYAKLSEGHSDLLSSLSPFYPFLLTLPPLTLLPLIDRILLLSILAIGGLFWLLVKIARRSGNHFSLIFLSFGISSMSWWSFRVIGSAHADSLFYLLLVAWLYLFIWGDKEENYYLPALGSLSAVMVWVKLNALFLLPLLIIWGCIERKKGWFLIAGTTLLSWLVYQWIVPENILRYHLAASPLSERSALEAVALLYENLSTWMQVSIGLVISDTLSHYIPRLLAFVLGVVWLAFLLLFLIGHKNKIGNKRYALLLFGTTYSLFFLGFQQWAGFREINFRTLFPYLLAVSWSLWLFLLQINRPKTLLVLALLVTGHTGVGHLLLWQRGNVASLFEARSFHNSELRTDILKLLEGKRVAIRTDYPEKLMLSYRDRAVIRLDPTHAFVNGKNEPMDPAARWQERQASLLSLMQGTAVIVLFQPTPFWKKVAENPSIQALIDNEALILYSDEALAK